MAETPKPIAVYALDGSTVNFPIPFEYLARKFIKVTLTGGGTLPDVELTLIDDYRFTSKTQITMTKAWGPGDGYTLIELRRNTSATERLVDFSDGSILRAYDLNTAQIQSLHIAEEGRSIAENALGRAGLSWNAANRRIINLADPVDVTDAANKRWTEQRLGQIIAAVNGDANVAGNVLITGFDGQVHNLQELAGPGGADILSYNEIRSIAEKFSDFVSIKDEGAIGDGTLHPVVEWYTAGFTHYRGFANLSAVQAKYPHVTNAGQSIDWVAAQSACNKSKGVVGAPQGVYFLNERLEVPDVISVVGDGRDFWDLKGAWRPRRMDRGTTFLVGGTPTTTMSVVNVSNMSVAGGVIPNDTPEGFAGNANYALLDFTNGDATGNAPATPKALKVGVNLGNNAHLVNMRVQLNYLGVTGYNCGSMLPEFPEIVGEYLGLGDNWDIGVMTYNKMQTGLKGVQVVGYWRMAARAVIASNYGDARYYGGAIFYDEDIFYQGFNGLAIRGNDVHRVTALTSTTVSVPWNASHTVPLSGVCYLGGTAYAYTSTAKSGDKIILSGFSVDPSTKTTVGAECHFGTNPGFAGSSVRGGFITGLSHSSNYRPFDPYLTNPTANPSKAHEISGSPLRDVLFDNVHFFDTEVLAFWHDCLHINYTGCYFEAQGVSGGIIGGPKGGRCIASPRIELADALVNAPYPAGNCAGLTIDSTSQMSDGSVDLYPVHRNAAGRYASGTRKYFMPDTFLLECIGYWPELTDTRRRYDIGVRHYMQGPIGGEAYFEVVDAALFRHMRINSDRRIGFGTAAPGTSIDFVNTNEASCRFRTTDGVSDPAYTLGNVQGSWTWRPQSSSFNQCQMRYNNTIMWQLSSTDGTMFSGAHNTASVGTQTNMYKFGYFGTAIGDATHKVPDGYYNRLYTDSGTVSVSDERLKVEIEGIPNALLDAWADVEYFQYRLGEQVDEMGAGAGILFGVMAQRVVATFALHGLNAFEYGVVTFQQWNESFDEMGVKVQDAGDRYGVVYEQAQILEAALQRRTTKRLEARLQALETI